MTMTAAALTTSMPDTPEVAELPPLPEHLWGMLFHDVQSRGLFADSKTFVDMIPTRSAEEIMADYARLCARYSDCDDVPCVSNKALREFVEARFERIETQATVVPPERQSNICDHIDALWNVLTRQPRPRYNPNSSRLPLPHAYVVPGGRFNEIYYWDSYFTMLGLRESGRIDLMRDMVNNAAFLINAYGHVPNGNRTYYLSRSQPPFFCGMVGQIAQHDGEWVYEHYLPQMEREYHYWMDGVEALHPCEAYRRSVKLHEGTLLNRHWDDLNTPREEAFREDMETANHTSRNNIAVWRNIRAGAESGWDFSSRWLTDPHDLSTIRTVDILPLDLNCLLYHMESTLASTYRRLGRYQRADLLQSAANSRLDALRRLFWSQEQQRFGDYLWHEDRLTDSINASIVFPLYFGIATEEQAAQVAETIEHQLLQPGGMMTSTIDTVQQWDAPNGWAPLQWMAIKGLKRYGHARLADTIARRWMHNNFYRFEREHKLLEKYNVMDLDGAPDGGEYPSQDGFGWTNGVLRALLSLYPGATLENTAP
ncbi:alpha,alpha-trehalase [Kushneria avicenniae]|uniref:Alpha,alpha-trehalase n=1 Tax=Kushneria avicenniae TaxID=402385 RepID=A0A1I1LUU6_9GAMM|nr:alpha,alpha-trehalase TreF [Kushneria avicenniae]SFC77007.1 alpha,alpha-trehalase [Kushneria avicenniae]